MNRFAKLVPIAIPALTAACGGALDDDFDHENASEDYGMTQQALRARPDEPPDFPDEPIPQEPPYRPPPVVTATPIPASPPDSDLRPDGSMRYYGGGATWGVQINVVNIGTTPATAASGRVSIGPYVYTGSLHQYAASPSSPPNTVNPGQRGYIKIDVPPNLLSLCGSYPVQIDLDHTMQSGTNPFANDSRSVLAYEQGAACRLTWYRPVNGATLGYEPDPKVAGKSLRDIVSSAEIARADNNRCSTCHNSASTYPYSPNVAPSGVSNPLVDPFTPISGTEAWIGTSSPWLPRFLELPDSGTAAAKPPYLKNAFRKWLLDGAIR